MASLVLVPVAKGGVICLNFHTKLYNVIPGIFQQPPTIFQYTNARIYRYDDYLAILAFNLLSYVVGAVAQLGEHFNFF